NAAATVAALRVQELLPPAVAVLGVELAVVQAELARFPELDGDGADPVAAPPARPGDQSARVLLVEVVEPLGEELVAVERPALARGPGAELALAGPAREVRVRFLLGHVLDGTLDAHLLAEIRVVDAERGAGVLLELVALAAGAIGVEDEAARVEGLEKDDANRWSAVTAGGRKAGRRRGGRVALARS